jgi:hypothetical protein
MKINIQLEDERGNQVSNQFSTIDVAIEFLKAADRLLK